MMSSLEFESAYVWENPTCPVFIPGKPKKSRAAELNHHSCTKDFQNGNNPDTGRVSPYEQAHPCSHSQ
jgi:hypothetical protein